MTKNEKNGLLIMGLVLGVIVLIRSQSKPKENGMGDYPYEPTITVDP